jgi:hypothetical protein
MRHGAVPDRRLHVVRQAILLRDKPLLREGMRHGQEGDREV